MLVGVVGITRSGCQKEELIQIYQISRTKQ